MSIRTVENIAGSEGQSCILSVYPGMRMKKPELLAPAGDFEKLRTAIHYGADAVYLGDSRFSLRCKAGNFEPEELKRGNKLCTRQK